jgi:hypothetical protein
MRVLKKNKRKKVVGQLWQLHMLFFQRRGGQQVS